MAGRYDRNPFDEEDEVNPFAEAGAKGKASGQSRFGGGSFFTSNTGSVPPATNSRLSPLPPEPADFYNPTASVDIPLDSAVDLKKKERELQAKEAELRKREQVVHFLEGVLFYSNTGNCHFTNKHPLYLKNTFKTLRGSSVVKLWVCSPMVTSSNPIRAIELQLHIAFCVFSAVAPPVVFRGKSLTGILPAVDLIGKQVLVGVFYFIGFGLFCLESVLSFWVIQQVYMYFRGSGKAAEMKREAARGAMRAAI
ncbi:secretory carrier-associated membrane protein 1-like [Olea europaea var. sylvestris]|uniref:secretory carrier-associated membrane protein 1-like n=1 Tax=Olea europaea var. sylvestris TaxID=158386 RepID=UPI000C1D0842|nr:secretory carrier-associated membrane protein 1-like [Olea europaea var. sylvestris]